MYPGWKALEFSGKAVKLHGLSQHGSPGRKYGDSRLRRKGQRISVITPEIRQLISDMFETMYAARGVGLAAQQVGEALQVTVIDVRGVKDRPSQLWVNSLPADVDSFMPIVLVNPAVRPAGTGIKATEGCLSFPELYGEIERSQEVEVTATNDHGERIEFRAGGLLARAILHEVDHLQGILFIDRMDSETLSSLKPELDRLRDDTRKALEK
jgi:peptide deformylase